MALILRKSEHLEWLEVDAPDGADVAELRTLAQAGRCQLVKEERRNTEFLTAPESPENPFDGLGGRKPALTPPEPKHWRIECRYGTGGLAQVTVLGETAEAALEWWLGHTGRPLKSVIGVHEVTWCSACNRTGKVWDSKALAQVRCGICDGQGFGSRQVLGAYGEPARRLFLFESLEDFPDTYNEQDTENFDAALQDYLANGSSVQQLTAAALVQMCVRCDDDGRDPAHQRQACLLCGGEGLTVIHDYLPDLRKEHGLEPAS